MINSNGEYEYDKKIITFLMIGCLICSCSTNQSNNTKNPSAYKVLINAVEKTNNSDGFKEVSTLKGPQFNYYYDLDEYGYQVERDNQSTMMCMNFSGTYYTIRKSEEYGSKQIYIDCFYSNILKDIIGTEKDGQYFYSDYFVIDYDDFSYSGFYNFRFISDENYKNCYEFSMEKNGENIIVNAIMKNPKGYTELENERLSKSDPDYDPLVSSNGLQLSKNEYVKNDYTFTINNEGYIIEYSNTMEIDYGDGYQDNLITEAYLSDFESIPSNVDALKELFNLVESNSLEVGDSISQYIPA